MSDRTLPLDDLSGAEWFKAEGVTRVLDLLNEGDGEARIVGGAVRNALMDRPMGDIDIATTLTPEAVGERAKAAGIKVVPTGIDHGTVTLIVAGQPFEVTTLRRDVKTDGRHADVAFGTDWAEDAARRDLTMNALYLDRHGRVIDLVDGMADIAAGRVRFIGDADLRIREDYLRILRFFRFFAYYGEGRPDADGIRAAARNKAGLARLSAERVWADVKKLLAAEDPARALLWMRQSGVLTAVLPETEKWGIDAIPGVVDAEQAFGWRPDPLLRLMAVVPPDAERIAAMAERLKMSNAEADRLVAFAEAEAVAHDIADRTFERVLYRADVRAVADRVSLALASARMRARTDTGAMAQAAGYTRLLDHAVKWERPVFPLSGKDLLAAGLEEGPALGTMRRNLEERWIDSGFSLSRDALLARVAVDAASAEPRG